MFLTDSGLNVTCSNMMLTQGIKPDDDRREYVFLWKPTAANIRKRQPGGNGVVNLTLVWHPAHPILANRRELKEVLAVGAGMLGRSAT